MNLSRCRSSRRRLAASVAAVLLAGAMASCTGGPPSTMSPAATPTTQQSLSPTTSRPPGADPRPDCLPGAAAYEIVPTGDRFTPVALLGERGKAGVVLGAQANGGICQMVDFATEVASRGYRVAVFEWASDNTAAMKAAVRAMTADGATRIVVGGFSEGAVIGLGAAHALGPRIVGVVAVSGGPSSEDGYPTVASVSSFRGPLLLISASQDPVFPPGTDAAIAAAHHGRETVVTIDGYHHALELLEDEQAPRVRDAIFSFLRSVLRNA